MLQNKKVSVYYGTKEAYEFEKQYKRIDENALYFIEGILYSGYELYSQNYKKVSSLPDVGQRNYLYINIADSSVNIWDGEQKQWIYICKPINNSDIINDDTSVASSSVVYKSLQEANKYTDDKCVEVIDTIEATIENSIFENNLVLFLGTSDKYNSIADITNALDTIQTNIETDLSNTYTKNEVDNKFSTLETNIDWKESVETYSDIAATYPAPQDGWTVNVKDTDYTYRYNGTEWIAISSNTIPKATSNIDGLLSKEDKAKLDDIANGAEANQNAFSNITVGTTTVAADSKTDTLTLVAGSNVTITPDTENGKLTISSTDTNTTYSAGTGISLSGTTFSNSGIRSVSTGTANGTISVNTNGTTANVAVKGLRSAAYTEVDSSLSSTSTNPLQNKAIYTELSKKLNISSVNTGAYRGVISSTSPSYATSSDNLPDMSMIANWNGAYNSNTNSRLAYCNKGAFGDACTKTVTDSASASAISTGTSLVTERDVYYGLPTINGSHTYTSSTSIYAPTSMGTTGYVLKSGSPPTWVDPKTLAAGSLYSASNSSGATLGYSSSYISLFADFNQEIAIRGNGNAAGHTTGILLCTYGDNTALFAPFTDNKVKCGNPYYRWSAVYAASSTISTSDKNLKDNIKVLDDKYKKLFLKLIPVSFTFKDGTSGRTHIGFIAQDVEEAMTELGLTAMDFAGFCKDKVCMPIAGKNGERSEEPVLDEDGEYKYIYSLRYNEFIAIITGLVQDLYSDVQDLKENLSSLI